MQADVGLALRGTAGGFWQGTEVLVMPEFFPFNSAGLAHLAALHVQHFRNKHSLHYLQCLTVKCMALDSSKVP